MNFVKYIFILSTILYETVSFNKQIKVDTHRFLNGDQTKIIKSSNKNTQSTAIVFFTGGSSFISPSIYSNLFSNLANNNLTIYTPYFGFKEKDKFIDCITKQHKSVLVAGHSSGCTTAINFCKNNKNIKKILLVDPVDTFFDQKVVNLPHINRVMFLIAGKTYKYSNDPPGIPFIPVLGYDSVNKKLVLNNNNKVIFVNNNKFGHSDILDVPWSNLMHYTRLSVGHRIRDKRLLHTYHSWIGKLVKNYA